MMEQKILIIIPAYNEEKSIAVAPGVSGGTAGRTDGRPGISGLSGGA